MVKIEITEVIEVPQLLQKYQKLHDKEEFDSKTEPQYGYVEIKGVVEKERTLYTQEVNQLDLVKVINAVNAQKEGKE